MNLGNEGFDEESKGLNFFRCTMCGCVVSQWDIKKHHGCKRCANPKIKPTELGFFEKLVQIFLHPMIWKWGKDV